VLLEELMDVVLVTQASPTLVKMFNPVAAGVLKLFR
jgi:hypothetical protein